MKKLLTLIIGLAAITSFAQLAPNAITPIVTVTTTTNVVIEPLSISGNDAGVVESQLLSITNGAGQYLVDPAVYGNIHLVKIQFDQANTNIVVTVK